MTATPAERTRQAVPSWKREATARHLERAADRIETNGWITGRMGDYTKDGDGPACAIGHLWAVARRPCMAEDAVSCTVGLPSRMYLPGWNDKQRDRRKVVRAFRRAARYLRGENR